MIADVPTEEICGVVLAVRFQEDVLSIWTRGNMHHREGVRDGLRLAFYLLHLVDFDAEAVQIDVLVCACEKDHSVTVLVFRSLLKLGPHDVSDYKPHNSGNGHDLRDS